MLAWPPIDEPGLRDRLALSDDAFLELIRQMVTSIPAREFTEEVYARAITYPWARPATSFLLDGEEVRPLTGRDDDAGEPRYPLLAFGSNGSPERLALKFAHLVPEQRRLPVLAGDLHGFDVGASAHPAFYGAFPATIFPSPGTRVRASVLQVTAGQLAALTWTEVSYRLGRLDGIRFTPDEPGAAPLDAVLAYASRLGAHRVGGEVVALAAVPAQARTAPAHTQEELLQHVAGLAYGEGASARDLVRRIMEDFGGTAATIAPLLRATAQPFDAAGWAPFPTG